MPDISAITAGLNALKHAIDVTKYLHNVDKKIDRADLQLKISEIAEALVEARKYLFDCNEEILKLRTTLKEIHQTEDFRKKLRVKKGVYYFIERIDGYELGPYCLRCFDVDLKLVLVSRLPPNSRNLGTHRCPHCKNIF